MTDNMKKAFENLKAKHADALILFRMGDFYELFEDDARIASDVLGIILHRRNGEYSCGFPYYALDTYLPKLIRAGHRVAITDPTWNE